MQSKRFLDWSFGHYFDIAPPSFVGDGRRPGVARRDAAPVAA
jgi:hypothetical protein